MRRNGRACLRIRVLRAEMIVVDRPSALIDEPIAKLQGFPPRQSVTITANQIVDGWANTPAFLEDAIGAHG
jgi:hypothetical protein